MPNFNEPTWGTPLEGDTVKSVYDWAQITPVQMEGVILRLVQMHFSKADNIEKPELKAYIWNSDKTQSKIIIAIGYEDDLKVTDSNTAAIYLHRDDTIFSSAGEFRNIVIKINNDSYPDNNYLRMANGKFILMCTSRSPTLAEYLGEEVLMRMMRFAPMITSEVKAFNLDVAGLGKATIREKEATNTPRVYTVPVILTWSYIYTWSLQDETVY